MTDPIRWTVQDKYGSSIYLTQKRWEHVIESINHPEMEEYEEELKETIKSGTRKQDSLNPQKISLLQGIQQSASGQYTHRCCSSIWRT